MTNQSLPEFCLATLAKEVDLERTPGFEEIEKVKLSSGEDGGGIKLYRGPKIDKVTVVDFTFGSGIPDPFHKNEIALGAELFQIIPDLSYQIPVWGINTVITKSGLYSFDTDFSFGFDLVQDYPFAMKYLEPFNETYKRFSNHKDLKRVTLDETTTWVRTYISPIFIIAESNVDKKEPVYELAAEFIKLWAKIYREAEKKDQTFKDNQQQRLKSQYAGMKDTDRMAKTLMEIFGQETFMKFFKAMV